MGAVEVCVWVQSNASLRPWVKRGGVVGAEIQQVVVLEWGYTS